MQKAGLASFSSGASLHLVLAFPFYVRLGGPLHLPGLTFGPSSARQHREHVVAGAITPVYRREKSLPMQGICATYRACPKRVN